MVNLMNYKFLTNCLQNGIYTFVSFDDTTRVYECLEYSSIRTKDSFHPGNCPRKSIDTCSHAALGSIDICSGFLFLVAHDMHPVIIFSFALSITGNQLFVLRRTIACRIP